MKIKILFWTIFLGFTIPVNALNIHQSISTVQPKPLKKTVISFEVSANCGQCKERIENALDKKGIYKATFNLQNHNVTVTYDPRQIEEIQLHNMIAMVGHDTKKVKASNVVYENLPDCCKYRDATDEWGH